MAGGQGVPDPSSAASTIEVRLGEEFVIRLNSNETTGYTWKGNEQYDASFLEMTASSYRPINPQRPGSGGEQFYRFKPLQPGITRISLTYKRSWETTPSDKTAVFTVHISNP